jgi:hypothetical protein
MTSVDEIEELIKPFLLTNITFFIEGKRVKTGKLILFTVRDFFCVFTLHDTIKNKKTIYEIPYPFNIYKKPNTLEFDYTIDAFSEKAIDIRNIIKDIIPSKTSKIFNKKVIVYSHI